MNCDINLRDSILAKYCRSDTVYDRLLDLKRTNNGRYYGSSQAIIMIDRVLFLLELY